MTETAIPLLIRPPVRGDRVFVALADTSDRLGWCRGQALPGGERCYDPLLEIGGDLAAGPFLYIVETDVEAAQEEEFNAWYDTDHLPSLAAVPGVLAAGRFLLRRGEAPRYLAAYRLERPEIFEGPDWLAARDTAWTRRVRRQFRNPRRTMRRLEDA